MRTCKKARKSSSKAASAAVLSRSISRHRNQGPTIARTPRAWIRAASTGRRSLATHPLSLSTRTASSTGLGLDFGGRSSTRPDGPLAERPRFLGASPTQAVTIGNHFAIRASGKRPTRFSASFSPYHELHSSYYEGTFLTRAATAAMIESDGDRRHRYCGSRPLELISPNAASRKPTHDRRQRPNRGATSRRT